MKSFCVLEQGCSINDPLTLKKKNLFTTEFSDFYRLNWKNDDDPNAFITKKGITWSEGRSLLYEKVPKNYEYYIFTDDDIEFKAINDVEDIPKKIKELLDEYKPISGTFFDRIKWNLPRSISQEVYLSKKAFPLAGYDLQTQILSRSFADVIFPVIYHGAEGTLWYSHWVCYILFPLKQICFTEIQGINTRHDGHLSDRENEQYYDGFDVTWLFNKDMKNDHLRMKRNPNKIKADIQKKTLAIFNQIPDKTKVKFSLGELEKIYDISNPAFYYRVSIADDMYMKRVEVSKSELGLFYKFYRFYHKQIKRPAREVLKYWYRLKKIIKNTMIQRKLNH
ncbi:hypothetical protein [Coleofasciculus chthonoplastes]|uniref:hypothetical protein n=1 Tax=Coleofasciculus chthonoplastes TaxID=64178 RepID=UPI0032F6C395